jgi:hypothetical protein
VVLDVSFDHDCDEPACARRADRPRAADRTTARRVNLCGLKLRSEFRLSLTQQRLAKRGSVCGKPVGKPR